MQHRVYLALGVPNIPLHRSAEMHQRELIHGDIDLAQFAKMALGAAVAFIFHRREVMNVAITRLLDVDELLVVKIVKPFLRIGPMLLFCPPVQCWSFELCEERLGTRVLPTFSPLSTPSQYGVRSKVERVHARFEIGGGFNAIPNQTAGKEAINYVTFVFWLLH